MGSSTMTLNDQPPKILEVEMRITDVKSAFRLSEDPIFRANLEAVAYKCAGKLCIMKQGTLIIQYPHYSGKCRVSRSGYVVCLAQLSMEEADDIAHRVLWDFENIAKQRVGLFKRQFIWINTVAELPFEVNLNRLKRSHPNIEFVPDISVAATIRFDDLKASINLYKSGKLQMSCKGDCDPPDYSMPKTTGTIEKLVEFVQDFIIPGSMKQAPVNISVSQSVDHLAKKKYIAPRRSERIRDGVMGDEEDSDGIAERSDDLSLLKPNEERLYQFFLDFATVHGEKQSSHILNHVLNAEFLLNTSTADSWTNVARMFLVKNTSSPLELMVPVILPKVVPLINQTAKLPKRTKKRSRDEPEDKRACSNVKARDLLPEVSMVKEREAADAIRTEAMTPKEYLERILGRMEEWCG